MIPASNLCNLVRFQTLHDFWLRNNGIGFPCPVKDAGLPEIVEAPGKHSVLVVDGEAVEGAAGDGLYFALGETELGGN
jgi:hypothetical protein